MKGDFEYDSVWVKNQQRRNPQAGLDPQTSESLLETQKPQWKLVGMKPNILLQGKKLQ